MREVERLHIYETVIRERHLDGFGHVNNARYFELFEEARWEWITAAGLGLGQVLSSGIAPVILDLNTRFRRELRLRETIRIETSAHFQKRRLGRFKQRILNDAGECCTEAEFVFALFDLVRRRMVPPSGDWARALGIDEAPAGTVSGKVSTSSTGS